jgi:hypothetical protein
LLERSLEERANERPLNERSFEKIVLAKEQPMNVPSLFYLMNGKRRTNERQKNGGNLPTRGLGQTSRFGRWQCHLQ